MKKTFGFVNVEDGVFHNITDTVVAMPRNISVSATAQGMLSFLNGTVL